MDLGIVGKANVGKTTFFAAATLAKAEIANYPFTTVKANTAVGYATAPCPCRELGVECNPNNSLCVGGTRLIPIQMIDVAGLVPGAHAGKGLGNQFLDDLRQAPALVHIVDLSGGTDAEGKVCEKGSHEPINDVIFLQDEIEQWFLGIVKKQWDKISRRVQFQHEDFYKFMAENLAGIGVGEADIRAAVKAESLDASKPAEWGDEGLLRFTRKIRSLSKPIVIAGNKIDVAGSPENLEKIKEKFPGAIAEPCSAESELALRRAEKAGLIKYKPGDKKFEVLKEIPDKQKKALGFIQEKVLKVHGSTGVQKIIDRAVYGLLKLIPVYPVEDENKYCDKRGNVLPDAYLVPQGTTALQLAYKVHTSIGENFIAAIDARTKRRMGKDHVLKAGDVVKIAAKT